MLIIIHWGGWYGSIEFPSNKEIDKDQDQGQLYFNSLSNGGNYDTFDHNQAKIEMNNILNLAAANLSADVTVLKKVVELALYNESLYGLNDMAKRCDVNVSGLYNNQRSLGDFKVIIDDQANIQNSTYNLDTGRSM